MSRSSKANGLTSAYPHLPGFGIAEALNVVLAERYGTAGIPTTDRQDFREIELSGGRYFRIIPYGL